MIDDKIKILLIGVTTLSGLTFGLMFGLLRVDTPLKEVKKIEIMEQNNSVPRSLHIFSSSMTYTTETVTVKRYS